MKRKLWITLPLVLLLIVLSGCQAVGNLDVKNAMIRNLDVQSLESNQTFSLQLTPSASASVGDRLVATMLNSSKLVIDSAKMQSATEMSLVGAVEYSGQRLPFHMYMNPDGIAINLDGAKQPIYISTKAYEEALGLGSSLNVQLLQGKQKEFAKSVASFLFTHLPNAANISADTVSTAVYGGETLDLTRLHIELDGQEVLQLIKPFLTSVAADEQGLKELIGAVYDYYAPVLTQMDTETGSYAGWGNRDEFVKEGYKTVSEGLNDLLQDYDQQIASLQSDDSFTTVFGPNTRVTTDVYFDKDLYARKQLLDVTIALPADSSYTSINLHSESEIWNVNGNVVADPVDMSAGALNVNPSTTPGTLLRNFDTNSPVYELLKMAGITHKNVYVGPYSDYETITRNKVTYIAVKDLASALDAQLEWNPSSKQVLLTDDITGAVVELKLNSKRATVNGQVRMLPANVIHIKGTTYVPLRGAANLLNATVNASYGDIVIERK
ncbi:copper amine oxidase N-terminal domain-containing protein [Paenibacillus campi]|uniref:copper amine oxidase N-terminal domain-containing protein n=1 Tax=Paenibacillus campi TaxID=3106031 RepID=UPI002AFF7984|nr:MULTISPECIES: copper amine oxidase N-terminal domain-containing protein [unclassified Paenibacillus]